MADIETNVTSLESIFSAPLAAVIKADFMAARQFVEYIERFGFVPPPPGEPAGREYFGDLRMTSFTFDQMQDGRPQRRLMRVPSLSLIPLPLLHVKQAEFQYGVRVLTARRIEPEARPLRLLRDGDERLGERPAYEWRAMLSADRSGQRPLQSPDLSPHLDANINVKVQVEQSGIPAGLANVLALMGEGAQVATGWFEFLPPAVGIRRGQRARARLALHDVEGRPAPHTEVWITYDAAWRIAVGTGDGPWPSGTSRTTDDHGRIELDVDLDEHSPLNPPDKVKVRFHAALSQADVAGALPLLVEPHKEEP